MRINLKIIYFVFLICTGTRVSLSQSVTMTVDSLKAKTTAQSSVTSDRQGQNQNMDQNRNNVQNQGQAGNINGNSQTGNNGNRTGNQPVKQVRSARPDMSKARGARPPQIERPSGSRIPKGIGKPHGSVRPGKK